MRVLKASKALAQGRPEGTWQIRVSHRKSAGKRDPRYLIKCGCCDQNFEIYYGGNRLEIAGVMGSIENWREILLPLLKVKAPAKRASRHQ
jgi:hypothetical protein